MINYLMLKAKVGLFHLYFKNLWCIWCNYIDHILLNPKLTITVIDTVWPLHILILGITDLVNHKFVLSEIIP